MQIAIYQERLLKKIYALICAFCASTNVAYTAHSTVSHTIAKGETLYTIAQMHHTTSKEVAQANDMQRGDTLKVGQVLNVPENTYFDGLKGYGIEKGDTLYTIAKKHHTTVAEILTANGINKDEKLKLGRILKVPQNTYFAENTQKPKKVLKKELAKKPLVKKEKYQPRFLKYTEHHIGKGDTLLALAEQYQTTVKEIKEANALKDNEILNLGRALLIPKNTYVRNQKKHQNVAKTNESRRKLMLQKVAFSEHAIGNGDTLLALAQTHHTTVKEIKRINFIKKDEILPLGRVLIIPKNTAILASKKIPKIPLKIVKVEKKHSEDTIPMFLKYTQHHIGSGDTLLALAEKYQTTVKEIKEKNHIKEGEILHLGRALMIPKNTYIRNKKKHQTIAKTNESRRELKLKNILFAEHSIGNGDTLLALAEQYNTTVKEIKSSNKLKENEILHLGRILIIPKNTYIRNSINGKTLTLAKAKTQKINIKEKVKTKIKEKIKIAKRPKIDKHFKQESNQLVKYSIKAGDTLLALAKDHHTTVAEIQEANKLKKTSILKLGQVLSIPLNTYFTDLAGYSIAKGDTLFSIARKHHTTVAEVRAVNKIKRGERLRLGRVLRVPQNTYNPNNPRERIILTAKVKKENKIKVVKYAIKKGDTLFTIARKHKTSVAEVRKTNKLKIGEKLYLGRVLRVPTNTYKAEVSTADIARVRYAKKKKIKFHKKKKRVRFSKRKIKTKKRKILVNNAHSKRAKTYRGSKRKKYELGDIFYSHLNKSTRKSSKIISLAKKKLGRRYVWGATGGRNTFDCSGLTTYVYKKNGIKLPRRAIAQSKVGKRISRKNLKKGDLIFFDTSRRRKGYVNHVGIYIGNNQFIHASSAKKKVVITSLSKPFYSQRFRGGRRM